LTETPARSRLGAFVNLMFGYDGRVGRLYFFLGFLAFVAIISLLLGNVEEAVAGTGDVGRHVAVMFIIGIGIWMHSAIAIKRLHDRDKAAGWYLVYGAAPVGIFIAAIYFYVERIPAAAWILFIASFAGLIWAIVELGFLRGTRGPNRFGPEP
jgi:uncharacterized membrane protein YhaH (DUF805 family)